MSQPIRVLVVDDSVVVRRLVTGVLGAEPDIEVVGTAANGRVALAKLEQLNPDLVTLDVEMPEMDGLEALRRLRRDHPRLPVVMFSTLTDRGAAATLDALEAGASDYVTKPANVGSVTASMDAVREQLVPRIRGLCRPVARPPGVEAQRAVTAAPVARPAAGGPVEVLALGASTGGPDALARLIGQLPASFPVPVVVVQHMPPVFTRQFAQRLDQRSALRVVEAGDGMPVVPGSVHVAPGDHHLTFTRAAGRVLTRLDQGTPEHYCRPAVDVMLRSAVGVWGGGVLAAVLTGMGADGASGCRQVVDAGGAVMVQDQATSVVWGMPGAVVGSGVPAEVHPVDDLGPALTRRVLASRRPVPPVPRPVVPSGEVLVP